MHGIAIAADLGKGFTSDGSDNAVTVFDIKTNKVLGEKIKTGTNPDSIIYEPVTHRVFTFNGRSSDSTAIDAKTGDVITASIPLGGKPEFVQADGKGHLYVNIENKGEIVEIDAKNALVSKRYSIAPCDSPSGLAISAKMILASVCDNKMAIISDPAAGKVLAMPEIGARPGRRRLRRRLLVQRQRRRRQHLHDRRDLAGQVRNRRHHRDHRWRAHHRLRSEGPQALSARRRIRSARARQRRQEGRRGAIVPDSFQISSSAV